LPEDSGDAEIQKRSYEITQTLFNNGQQSELDFQQAETQYMATLSGVPGLGGFTILFLFPVD
jgi:hypothetical protein